MWQLVGRYIRTCMCPMFAYITTTIQLVQVHTLLLQDLHCKKIFQSKTAFFAVLREKPHMHCICITHMQNEDQMYCKSQGFQNKDMPARMLMVGLPTCATLSSSTCKKSNYTVVNWCTSEIAFTTNPSCTDKKLLTLCSSFCT